MIVERWNGVPFTKPLTRVREAVEALRPILAGDAGRAASSSRRRRSTPVPIYIAALRDKMLRLGGSSATARS